MAIRSLSITCGGCKYKYVVTAKRGPLRDADCYWDYGKACCAWQEYCEYRFSFLFHLKFHIYYSEICNFNYCETECRYSFGDVHLGQSCRLRNTSANMLLQYIQIFLLQVTIISLFLTFQVSYFQLILSLKFVTAKDHSLPSIFQNIPFLLLSILLRICLLTQRYSFVILFSLL